jgi:hypothetical protein
MPRAPKDQARGSVEISLFLDRYGLFTGLNRVDDSIGYGDYVYVPSPTGDSEGRGIAASISLYGIDRAGHVKSFNTPDLEWLSLDIKDTS